MRDGSWASLRTATPAATTAAGSILCCGRLACTGGAVLRLLLPLLAPCCRLRGEQGASLLLGHACRFARLSPAQLGACRCHTTAARHGGPRRCTAIITAHTACGLPLLAAHSAAPAACHVAAAKSGTNASGATQRPRLTFGDTFCRVIPRRSSRHPHPTPPPRFCCVRTRHSVAFGVSCSLVRGPHGTRSALGQQGPTRRLEAHAILLLPTAALCCTRPATMPSQRTRTMVHVALAVAVVAFVARQLQHDREAFVAQLCTWTSAAVVVAAVLLLAAVHLLVDNWSALFGTVEEGLEKHGGQLVASVLKEHGSWTVCSVIDRAHVSCGPHARLPHAPPHPVVRQVSSSCSRWWAATSPLSSSLPRRKASALSTCGTRSTPCSPPMPSPG